MNCIKFRARIGNASGDSFPHERNSRQLVCPSVPNLTLQLKVLLPLLLPIVQ